jgi:hypothetical protein
LEQDFLDKVLAILGCERRGANDTQDRAGTLGEPVFE